MLQFLRDNLRWLGAGLLLTFASSFGQTWFISLFAAEIKAVHGLSEGAWGGIYTAATLAAAALLFARGSLADTMPLARLAPALALLFAAAGLAMAVGHSIWLLGASIFLLRFCGQGMFTACRDDGDGTLVSRPPRSGGRDHRTRLSARRGDAAVADRARDGPDRLAGDLGRRRRCARRSWSRRCCSCCWSRERAPQGDALDAGAAAGLRGLHWTRGDALRHWLFPALVPMLLTPGFIGTVVFFHQVHIAEVKGWTLAQMAPGYTVYAAMTVVAALATGWAADRFGPARLLPVLLVPMGLGVMLIGPAAWVGVWFAALGILALTQGMAGALWGTFLPAAYGTRHLGAVRSLATVLMVVASAIGPGVTGVLIDHGVNLPQQCLAMGLWCLALSAAAIPIARRARREAATPRMETA